MTAFLRFLVIALFLAAADVQAQPTYCYPLDSDSSHNVYLDNVRKLASDPDTAYAAHGIALGYPRVSASAVVLVREEAVCQAAAQAFAANVPAPAFGSPSGKVFVVSVGPTHYYVVDPEYHATENFTYFLLFTSSWTFVFRHGH